MIDIPVLTRFVFEPTLGILAIECNIILQMLLRVDEMAFMGDLLAEVAVDDVEDCPYPERVAGV